MKQISVQKSADEKKKFTKTTDIGPNNPVKSISLSSNKMEKEQSGKSTEQPESRKCKEKEQKEIPHYCYNGRLMSDGRIYFIENSPCGCEEWKSKNESKLDIAR